MGWVRIVAILFLLGRAGAASAAEARRPQVSPDGSVIFQLAWNGPGPVTLIGRSQENDFPQLENELASDGHGLWSVTLGPLIPGLYYYRFRAGGVEMVDPVNPSVEAFFSGPWSSVEIPDPEPRPWQHDPRVPHGRVEFRTFGSEGAVGWIRPVVVYVPPGYDDPGSKPLPVVYLLHGWDYNERMWVEDGKVPVILDNLIAAGHARPMLVVMPLGFSEPPLIPISLPRDEQERWTHQIVDVLIPWIEANYRVAADREHRAIAGFSMGGKQALVLGLGNPERFAWAAAFSSGKHSLANYPHEFEPAFAPDAPKMSLVWLGSGRNDRYFKEAHEVSEKLASRGLPVTWHAADGRHTWRVWRECFSEFAQRVFQTKGLDEATKGRRGEGTEGRRGE